MKIQFNSKIKAVVLSLITLSGLAAISYAKKGSFTPPEGAPMAGKNVTYSSNMSNGESESTSVGGPGGKSVNVTTVYMPGTTKGTGSVNTTYSLYQGSKPLAKESTIYEKTEGNGSIIVEHTSSGTSIAYKKPEDNGGVRVEHSSSGTLTENQAADAKKAEPYLEVTSGRQFIQEKATVTGKTPQAVGKEMEFIELNKGVSQTKIDDAKSDNQKIQTGVDYAINNPNPK
jgi:hypothetical protein